MKVQTCEGGEERGAYSLWSSTYIYINKNTAVTSKYAQRTNMYSEVEVQTFS
jgi:hypothetical protein